VTLPVPTSDHIDPPHSSTKSTESTKTLAERVSVDSVDSVEPNQTGRCPIARGCAR
jgi:hypothetical protein